MNQTELEALPIDELIHDFERAIELKTTDSGNGHSPFDIDQLRRELKRRMEQIEQPW